MMSRRGQLNCLLIATGRDKDIKDGPSTVIESERKVANTIMEEVLRQQLIETSRYRTEYESLYERFKKASEMFDERDSVLKALVGKLKVENDDLRHHTEILRQKLKRIKKDKRQYEMDVNQLQHATSLLENREGSILAKYASLADVNRTLRKDLTSISLILEESERNFTAMKEDMETKYVHCAEFDELNTLLKEQEVRVLVEHVPINMYKSLEEEHKNLQQNIEKNFVSIEQYKDTVAELERIRAENDCLVPKVEHMKLHQQLHDVMEDSRMIEQSVLVLETTASSFETAAVEAEAKCASLRSRIEQYERELETMKFRESSLTKRVEELEFEIISSEDEKGKAVNGVMALEREKAALLNQLSASKSQLRRAFETEATCDTRTNSIKIELDRTKRECALQLDALNDLIQANKLDHERAIEQKDIQLASIRAELQERVHQLETTHQVELETLRSSHANEISSLLGRITTLDGDISRLTMELSDAVDRHHTLSLNSSDSSANYEVKIELLSRGIASIQSEKESISSLLDSERARADKNHAEKVKWEALAGEVEHWKLQTDMAWKQVDSMRRQIEECSLSIEALRLEKTQLAGERDELRKISSGLGSRINVLESEIGAFKAAVLEPEEGDEIVYDSRSRQRFGDDVVLGGSGPRAPAAPSYTSPSPIFITTPLLRPSTNKKGSAKKNITKK